MTYMQAILTRVKYLEKMVTVAKLGGGVWKGGRTVDKKLCFILEGPNT